MTRQQKEQAQLACKISIGLMAGVFSVVPSVSAAPVHDPGSSYNTVPAVNITTSGTVTNVQGPDPNNVVAWKDFSVGETETVQFDGGQKTNNYLNIVTGQGTSQIAGAIEGGKDVYIVNPHGVVFGENAKVDVGNLYVSTENTAKAVSAFTAGKTGSDVIKADTAKADVVNLGTVNADKVQVSGENIRFLDSGAVHKEDGTTANTDVTLSGTGYIHVGNTAGTSAGYAKGGTASVEYYKLVHNATELNNMSKGLSGKYMLAGNITNAGTITPIGTSKAPFKGKFDGMFYEIKGMKITAAATDAGLFGYTSGARIENLGVVGANIAPGKGNQNVGSIVGTAANTTIRNVYSEGSTITVKVKGGGLVGNLTSGSTLSSSYNTSKVAAGSGYGAGLVGNADSGTTIQDSYNLGAITGDSCNKDRYGIAFTGTNSTNPATITRVYNAYNGVTFTDNKGGKNISASFNFYSGTKPGSTSDAALSTAENISTYSAWGSNISGDGSTDTTWRIYEGQSTPLLTAFFKGNVTADYNFNYFANSTDTASTSNGLTMAGLSGTTANNNTQDIAATYNAQYLKIADSTGYGAGTKSDVTFSGNVTSSDSNLTINTTGIRNVVSDSSGNAVVQSLISSGQHGYNIIGGGVKLEKRKVSASGMATITKEYDGTTDGTDAFAQALTGGSANVNIAGIIPGDSVTLSNVTATYQDSATGANDAKDVGTSKPVSVSVTGTAGLSGASAGNYSLDTTGLKSMTVTGDITPRAIYVDLKSQGSFDKTYDGDATVTDTNATVANNVDFDTTKRVVTVNKKTDDVSLDTTNGATIEYYYKNKTVSDAIATTGATSYDIRYTNLKLTGNDAKNYQLVVANAKSTKGYDVLYDGSTQTAGTGYLTASGIINQRVIDPASFQVVDKTTKNVLTAEKDYDGTSTYSLPTDAQGNLTAEISPTGTSTIKDSGLVSGENILFTPTGTANFTESDGTTKTSQVKDAALVAVGLSAAPDPQATKTTKLTNYTWGQNGSTLTSTGTYDVTIAGKINPRTITVLVNQTGDIDKTYDGKDLVNNPSNPPTTQLNANAFVFGQTGSIVTYDPNTISTQNTNHQIITDQTNGKAPTMTITPTYASKDVERDANWKPTAQAINYDVLLSGTNAENYKLVSATTGSSTGVAAATTAGANGLELTFAGSITGTQKGTINPIQLNAAFNNSIEKPYDGTTNVDMTKVSGTLGTGILTADQGNIQLDTKNLKAAYHSENVDGNVNGVFTKNASGQTNWIDYTGVALIDKSTGQKAKNYDIASTAEGAGKITKLTLKKGDFDYTYDTIKKEYDGTDAVNNAASHLLTVKVKSSVSAKQDVFKDITNGNNIDHTSNVSATYASPNSKGGAAQTVTYQATINDDGSGNFDWSNLPNGIADTDTKTTTGTITARKVKAVAAGPLTKTYDGTDTATATNGNALVMYTYAGTQTGPQQGLINNGTVTDTDNSSAVYTDKRTGYNAADAGTTADKTVAYTIGIKTADATNYEVIDGNNGNTLYTGGKATANTLSGTGSINKRALKITFGYTDKSWDGSDVATGNKTAVNATLDDSNAAGNKDGKSGIIKTDGTDTVFQSNLSKIAGNYVDSNDKSQTNAGTGFTVNYSKIDDAFKVTNNGVTTDYGRNYTFSLTGTGTGDIDPLTITGNNLHLDFDGITKEYDGGNSVVGKGGTSSYGAADYITDNWVDVDGDGNLTSKDVILGGGSQNGASSGLQSMIQSATYDDTQGNAGTSKSVTYELNLGNTNNFSFASGFTNISTGSNALTSYANGVLTSKTTGDITKRKVVASPIGAITKTYDATTNLPSTAGTLISYTHYGTPGKGLVGNGDKDASTGKFIQSDAGSAANLVTYNLAINNGNNYEIVDSNGAAISTLDGAGTINKRALTINFGKTVKSWDGSDVATGNLTPINATLSDANNGDGKTGVFNTDGTDKVFQSNLSKITGQYLSGGKSQTNAGKNFDVQYSNYANAFIDAQNNDFGKNYVITAATGKGDIDPLAINSNNFHLEFSGITKEYDATDKVVGTGGTSSYGSGDYVTLNWIDVDGDNTLTKKDVVLGGGSTNGATAGFQKLIQSATYDNNANGNVGNGQGVTYVLNLGNPQNYTFTGFTNVKTGKYTTASYANGKLTANTIGDITKRKVVASATNANPTKTYDAGTALVNSTKYPLTTPLVSYTHYGTAGAGLVGSDKDASTGKYTSAGAGTGSNKVQYSLAINNGSNYEIVDSTGKAISTLDGTGTINKAPLTIDFGDVWKVYDGNADVTTSSGAQYSGTTAPSANPQTAITPTLSGFVGGQNVAFDPTATKLISGSYVKWDPSTKTWVVDPHVNWQNVNTQTLGYKAVGYSNLDAAFANLASRNSVLDNYELTGATNAGASVTANASGIAQSVYFSEALKKGQILPLALTMGNIQSKVTTTTKEYDGTADVKDPTKTLTLFENLTGKNVVIPYTLQSATYDNGQVDQTNGKAVGVTYTLDAKNPFPAMTLNDFVINGTTQQAYQGKTFTGDGVIDPKNIYVQLDKTSGIKKEYDHSTDADPDNVQYYDTNGTLLGTGNNTGNIIVSRDQGKVSLSVKSALFDDENATIDRANSTSKNAQNITYTVDLDDATNKGNYVLLDTNAKAAGTPTAVTVTNPTTGATTTLTQTENVYKATGDIYRAAIKVQSNGQSIQTGKQPSAYTGKTSGWITGDADSTAWTSAGGDKQLTWNVLPGATTGSAGSYDIYGWYRDPKTGAYPSTTTTVTDPVTNAVLKTVVTYQRPDNSTLTKVTDQTTGVVTWSGVDAQGNALPSSALTGWFASLDPTNATATDWASDGTAEYQIKTGNYGTNYYFEQVPSQLTVYAPSHHGGGGGGGTKPVTPVTPVTPDNPVTPVTPDNPVTPVIPDVPDDPVLPVNPLDISKETNPAKQFVPNSEAYNNASHDDFGSVTRSGQAGIEYASGGINVAGAETPTVSTSDVDNAAIGLQNAGSIVNLSGGDAMEVNASRIDLTGGDSFTVTVDDGTTYDSSAAIETTGAQTKDSAAAVDTTALDATGTQTKDGAAAVDTTALDATSTLETTSDATATVETVEPDATLTTTQQMLTTEDVQLFADATSLNDAEETEETEDEDEERKEADASAAADESAIGIESEGAGVKVA